MDKMYLQVISPKRIIFDGECKVVEYNTDEGYVGVYPGHVAMTQILAPGKFTIYLEGKEPIVGVIHSGTAKIMPDVVTILAEVCEFKEEIDIERAKASKERALKRMEEKVEGFDYERAKCSLIRAEERIKVASN